MVYDQFGPQALARAVAQARPIGRQHAIPLTTLAARAAEADGPDEADFNIDYEVVRDTLEQDVEAITVEETENGSVVYVSVQDFADLLTPFFYIQGFDAIGSDED